VVADIFIGNRLRDFLSLTVRRDPILVKDSDVISADVHAQWEDRKYKPELFMGESTETHAVQTDRDCV